MSDITIIGGCIIDLVSYVTKFPRPGETIVGKQFIKGYGGKGANQCVMASKLGALTSMIAKLGDDNFGHEYLENFRQLGIHCDHVTMTTTSHTSTASISVSSQGQNCIIYVPGAVMELKESDISAAETIIKNSKLLLCTYECPADTLVAALSLARKYKVKTIVNAAPATDASYEKIYPLTDIVCLNEIEAEESTGIPVNTLEDAASVIKTLQSKGCSTVILTLGARGAVFQTKTDGRYTLVPAKPVKAVDSTGAGDAFMGSLAFYISVFPNMSLEQAIKNSCEIATISVLRKGTQTSFPDKSDLPVELFA